MNEELIYNLSIVIRAAADVPGMWVAHCLDVDVITTGYTLGHTFEMIYEAVNIVVADDIEEGLNPLDRRAPQEFWDEWEALSQRAAPCVSPPAFSGERPHDHPGHVFLAKKRMVYQQDQVGDGDPPKLFHLQANG